MAFGDRNVDKLRAWQQRGAERWQRNQRDRREIASSELVPTLPSQSGNSKRKPRPAVPPGVRQAARARSGGRCIVCVFEGRGGPSTKAVHLHHVLPKGLARFSKWAADSRNLVGLCFDCHMAHENASRRVPWEALPDETVRLIAQVGGPAVEYCRRIYPRVSGHEEAA